MNIRWQVGTELSGEDSQKLKSGGGQEAEERRDTLGNVEFILIEREMIQWHSQYARGKEASWVWPKMQNGVFRMEKLPFFAAKKSSFKNLSLAISRRRSSIDKHYVPKMSPNIKLRNSNL